MSHKMSAHLFLKHYSVYIMYIIFPHTLSIHCNRKLMFGTDDLCIVCLK